MELQAMAYRFKPSPACAMSTVLSRRSSALRTRQCGPCHCLRIEPAPARLFVVRSAKDSKGGKDSGKGQKKKGGKGGKGEQPAKKAAAGPRPNVWSKDIAESEYQASRGAAPNPPSSKQQRGKQQATSDVRGNGRSPVIEEDYKLQDFGDDFTAVMTTGGIPVETSEVLQTPEQMPTPLWPTFVSSNAGVWRGYGAAFSPITAEMEPVALDVSKAYLYDAAVLTSVEPIPGPDGLQSDGTTLYRKVMWKVGNTRGEQGYKEYQEDLEEFGDELDGEEDLAVNPIELESSAIAEGMALPTGEEEELADSKAFLQGSGTADYNPEKESAEDWALRESDPEFESMFEAGTADSDLEEELNNVPEATNNVPTPAGEGAPASNDVWRDVMEEDTMSLEPGLVFFSDGAYSRGPLSLLPDDLNETEPDYFNAPTFKIEQCIVTGKHRRLRLVHTIAIMESGEEIQVLRVAVYEEQWMGPRNMESISSSESAESLAHLSPFSQRDRPAVNDLTGSWKVFEMSATAIHQPGADLQTRPSYAHFCQEVMLKQGLPEALQMYVDEDGAEPVEDPVVLWLPGGITASVQAKEDGVLTVGVGWFYEKGTFLCMERDYGPDGKLLEVRSQTKVKGGWAGGSM